MKSIYKKLGIFISLIIILLVTQIPLKVFAATNITDDGRAHQGYSQFRAKVNSGSSVTLRRRLDYGVGNQKANVYVDGSYVGSWYNSGKDTTYQWRDTDFTIPSSNTSGKSYITVRITFVSSDYDWNEFYYWIYSGSTLTDTVDIGNASSENSHSYIISNQTWTGTRTFQYAPRRVVDNGRAHQGYSQFNMRINSNNSGVSLIRRLDYGIGNQKAYVYVDGSYAGTWSNPGSDTVNQWREYSFSIPSNLTQGKSLINIKIVFVSSDYDWNEFYYWVSSNGVITDSLDVGNSTSEDSHNYFINNQTWSGTRDFTYPN